MAINETHDPDLKSWVDSANDPGTDFPIQNLPFCMFEEDSQPSVRPSRRYGVLIGDYVLDVPFLWTDGRASLLGDLRPRIDPSDFHGLAGAPRPLLGSLRLALSRLLRAETASALRDDPRLREAALFPRERCRFVGVRPRNYTDFYASIHHAARVGSMFRPENPLLPNYKWVPIGYHGRASSIVPSGSGVRRPRGQTRADDTASPEFGPCQMLDYELEVGCVIGQGNALGEGIAIGRAREHVFGVCLVNDWSARDVQKWEYQPLGPFLSKSFATTISPCIVTMEALEPFRCPAYARPEGDPRPLAYLHDEADQAGGGLDLMLEVYLQSNQMRARGMAPTRLSHGSAFRDMYWTFAQMIAHHTSNGCNFQPGDLIASGTVSGPEPHSRGCLLELTWDGPGRPRRPVELPSGETRLFLQDGDEVILKGYCEREGFRRIGLGECRGRIAPAAEG